MGIPVVTEPIDPSRPDAGTGYRVPRDLYELPDAGLDEDELVALGLAASAVAFEGMGAELDDDGSVEAGRGERGRQPARRPRCRRRRSPAGRTCPWTRRWPPCSPA